MTPSPGFFYVIQLAPDVASGRVKLGWTHNPEKRLLQHRCSAPTATLLCSWPCSSSTMEKAAIREATRLGCTALSGEVFDCDDLPRLLAAVEMFFASGWRPPSPRPRRSPRVYPPVTGSAELLTGVVDDDLLTVPEIAARLRLNQQTIRKWLRLGTLPGISLGSRQAGWRVRRADLETFLEKRQQGEGAAPVGA